MRPSALFLAASAAALHINVAPPRSVRAPAPQLCAAPAEKATAETAQGVVVATTDKPRKKKRQANIVSPFPTWPENAIAGRRELPTVLEAFEQVAIGVPLNAASAPDAEYRTWLEGGFAAHKFINQKMSRQTYLPIATTLLNLIVVIQKKYPDLYAVIKFVPKKNGLNPLLGSLQKGDDPETLRIDQMRPREVKRRLDDLRRAMDQSWLMLSSYLTLPSRVEREDFLWSARTVVEKVKTDQRSRALELLCLGFFNRDAAMYPLVVAKGLNDQRWPLKKGFEANFGVEVWHPKPTNARMIWQRSRMVYPFLECAHRAWLNYTGVRRAAARTAAAAQQQHNPPPLTRTPLPFTLCTQATHSDTAESPIASTRPLTRSPASSYAPKRPTRRMRPR